MEFQENNKESCPKCQSNDITFEGHWTGVMVSDVYAEHFWMGKCNSCDFIFKSSFDTDKHDPIDDKRNHA